MFSAGPGHPLGTAEDESTTDISKTPGQFLPEFMEHNCEKWLTHDQKLKTPLILSFGFQIRVFFWLGSDLWMENHLAKKWGPRRQVPTWCSQEAKFGTT